jgi:DNA (cytosine-5)-methyltransferase 1
MEYFNMKAVSLFSGAGGMDVGFERAGFDIVAASELDAHACATFRENHPQTILYEGDITKNIEKLASVKNVDIVFGGPPCQGFSVAGKMDSNDPRSKLIFSFADVIGVLNPRAFVMENVKALGELSKFAEVRRELMTRFFKSGYTVNMHVLNAKDFGVPQSRERVFFIGVKPKIKLASSQQFKKYILKPPSLREAIGHLGPAGCPTNNRVCNAKVTLASKPILRKSPYAGMMFNGQGRPLNPDGWASTLPASMGGNRTPIVDERHLYSNSPSWVEHYHHHLMKGGKPYNMNEVPGYLRRLTVDEAILLQGFPADYKFCGPQSRVFSQIGNAVPCKLAQVVASVVRQLLEEKSDEQQHEYGKGENLELSLVY